MNDLGLYIHIPFCAKKCGYCDFYSVRGTRSIDEYISALTLDLRNTGRQCREYTVDTVYVGGGTPSLMSTENMNSLFSAVHDAFTFSDDCEITVECNPASSDVGLASSLKSAGVNRISLGMQSSDDDILSFLGRSHDRRGFENAYSLFRHAGFDNISVDIMYGIPGENAQSVKRDALYALSLECEHVSCYLLKVESGTAFSKRGIVEADGDEAFIQYKTLCDTLGNGGFERYEISNFTRDGRRSRHNMKYWTCGEYLGFGPAAYSYFGGRRYGNARNISAYIHGENIRTDIEIITEEEKRREKIMLGLRLSDGIPEDLLDESKVSSFKRAGYLTVADGRVSLTTEGFFLSNLIISEFLD